MHAHAGWPAHSSPLLSSPPTLSSTPPQTHRTPAPPTQPATGVSLRGPPQAPGGAYVVAPPEMMVQYGVGAGVGAVPMPYYMVDTASMQSMQGGGGFGGRAPQQQQQASQQQQQQQQGGLLLAGYNQQGPVYMPGPQQQGGLQGGTQQQQAAAAQQQQQWQPMQVPLQQWQQQAEAPVWGYGGAVQHGSMGQQGAPSGWVRRRCLTDRLTALP